jgi:hypothetical protein
MRALRLPKKGLCSGAYAAREGHKVDGEKHLSIYADVSLLHLRSLCGRFLRQITVDDDLALLGSGLHRTHGQQCGGYKYTDREMAVSSQYDPSVCE